VLIAPPTRFQTLGETVVIAWNRSTETARAVLGAMPIMAKARRIVVLELDDWGVAGPSGSELVRSLRMRDLPAEAVMAPDPSNRPGEAILSEARALGCDLLVKGAYTQSRLRQMFFGGATSHILNATTMPVLMAH
jgi:nucleotide-binding universal stress UspA family protein